MSQTPIPEELRRSFDQTILLISAIKDEAEELKVKFGERSKLYKTKIAQVETLSNFYNASSSYIEHLLKMLTTVGVDIIGANLCLMQREHNLTFGQAAKALGYDFKPEFIEVQELIDELIKEATK